ncbi:MAG: condensation domain-containing protein [Cyanobacteria bacterium P01_F01_bin.86]
MCSPIANRNRKELRGLIGYFVNLLILRTDLAGNASFRELVGRVRQGVSGAYAHQDLPVQQLVSHLDMGQAALSQVMFVLQNTPREVPRLADLDVSAVDIDNGMADFDLFLSLVEESGTLHGVLKYNTDLFEATTIEQLLRHYQTLLEQVVANPDTAIAQLLPLSEAELQQLQQKRVNYQTKPQLEPQRDFVKPRNRLELQLVNIWEKVLGIQPISVKDNFFDLGGESLMAMRLFAQIERQLGKNLSLAMLLQTPTVEQLAQVLQQQKGQATDALRSLVTLQIGDAKPPLFIIPPGATTALHYAPLLHYLDADQSVYGLEYLGMDGKDFPHTCVEDMATHYIQEIQTLQPEGPYFLVGRCFGGVVAFEIAQQLQAQGQQVALLGILDTLRPPGYRDYAEKPAQPADKTPQPSSVAKPQKVSKQTAAKQTAAKQTAASKPGYYFQRLTQLLQEGTLRATIASRLEHKTFHLLDRIHTRAKKQQFLFPTLQKVIFSSLSQDSRISFTFRAQKKARKTYVAEVYPGKITLFNNSEFKPGSQAGWAHLAGDGLVCCQVPGDHKTMFREPHVRVTAAKLMSHLQAVQKAAADQS